MKHAFQQGLKNEQIAASRRVLGREGAAIRIDPAYRCLNATKAKLRRTNFQIVMEFVADEAFAKGSDAWINKELPGYKREIRWSCRCSETVPPD
jgi:hypothetical protein